MAVDIRGMPRDTTQKTELNFEEAFFDDQAGSFRKLEHPISTKAFWLAGGLGVITIAIVLTRIFIINVYYKEFYKKRAAANVNQEFIIPALRGIITDRFGNPLVKNVPSFSVSLNKTELLKNQNNQKNVLKEVANILNIPEENIREAIQKVDLETESRLLLARNISLEQAIDLRSLQTSAVLVEDDYKRDYADPMIISHILGYTGLIDWTNGIEGKTGLEDFHDNQLRGVDGSFIVFRDAKGNPLQQKITREAKAGEALAITIDAEFQKFFYERFKQGLQELDREAGVGIAMDPKTGEILSLVSFPSFNNNEPVKFLDKKNQPLFNRAISGQYSPGSTIKPLVALAALVEGVVNPTFTFNSPGYLEIPNPYDEDKPSRFLDWKAHGDVDLRSALARSSNVYFYVIGGGHKNIKGLGIKKLNEYWKKFGLNQKSGIDLSFESTGFLPDAEEKQRRTGQPWRIGDTYNVSIGQGDLTLTPIRLLTFISSIANNGKMMKPHFLLSEEPTLLMDFSEWGDYIKEIKQGMRDAVGKHYGTANLLFDLPYRTAGKTGSAQVANKTKTNAFFVGYGPADDPKIAILVLVEDAKEGSLNAVPIAKDVLKWYYNHRL